MKVGIYTLGCKVNTYESEFVTHELKKAGFTINMFDDVNDIYIINTCTVTNNSDVKSRKMIRHARKLNPDAVVVAMGCFVEYNKKDIEEIMPEVDIIIGNVGKSRIVELINEYLKEHKKINILENIFDKDFEDMYIDSYNTRTRAFVKVQDGCENYCSYCVIPRVRGKRRSKRLGIAVKEIETLVKNGYKEIILTGIHTGSYGSDIGLTFADLLREIVKIEGLKRLRISSIEATELTDEVLDIIKNNKVIVNHFHVPVQSCSNKVLELMNRKYTIEEYMDIINKLREVSPDCAITTDIITGHPGENDEEFKTIVENVKKIDFAKLHVFPYSVRQNTKSASLPQVPEYLKKDHTDALLKLSYELENKYMKKFAGETLEVLFETSKDGYSYGHTTNYIHVKVLGKVPSSSIKKVRLINIEYPYFFGEISEDED